MTDVLAERAVRHAIAAPASAYATAPQRATAAKEMLARAPQGEPEQPMRRTATLPLSRSWPAGLRPGRGAGLTGCPSRPLTNGTSDHPESPCEPAGTSRSAATSHAPR